MYPYQEGQRSLANKALGAETSAETFLFLSVLSSRSSRFSAAGFFSHLCRFSPPRTPAGFPANSVNKGSCCDPYACCIWVTGLSRPSTCFHAQKFNVWQKSIHTPLHFRRRPVTTTNLDMLKWRASSVLKLRKQCQTSGGAWFILLYKATPAQADLDLGFYFD